MRSSKDVGGLPLPRQPPSRPAETVPPVVSSTRQVCDRRGMRLSRGDKDCRVVGTWTADERMRRLSVCDWSGARMAVYASQARFQCVSLVLLRLSIPRTLLLLLLLPRLASPSILTPSPVSLCFFFSKSVCSENLPLWTRPFIRSSSGSSPT